MTVSGTWRWRSELLSQISEPVKRHGGSEGDGISAVGCAMASFYWWGSALDGGLSTLLFSIWRFEVVDLKFFFFFCWIYVLCFWSSGSPQSWAHIGVTGFGGVVGFSIGFGMKNSCGQRGYMVRTGSGFSFQISWGKKLGCIGLQISWGKYLSNGMSGDWVISDG